MSKEKFKSDFNKIRAIINSWNLLPGCPEDEFDFLTFSILGKLQRGTDYSEITYSVHKELNDFFGSDGVENKDKTANSMKEIYNWWERNNDLKRK